MEDGLNILLVGMGAVFAFLALLIAMMLASGRIFQALAARAATTEGTEPAVVAVAAAWRRRQAARPPGA